MPKPLDSDDKHDHETRDMFIIEGIVRHASDTGDICHTVVNDKMDLCAELGKYYGRKVKVIVEILSQ